jgi:hypothetical protein
MWPTPRIARSQLKKPKAKESPLKRVSLFWLEPRMKFFLVKLKLDLLYIHELHLRETLNHSEKIRKKLLSNSP